MLHKKRNTKQKQCFHKCCTLTHACTHHTDLTKEKKMGDKNYVYNDSLGFTQALLHSYSTYHIITSQQHSKALTSRRFLSNIQQKTERKEMRMRAMYATWLSYYGREHVKNIIVVWWYGVASSFCIHSFPFNLTRRSRHTINAILVLLFMKISESIMIRNL